MDGMNLYLRGETWWIRFQDHRNRQRRVRGAKSKRTAERIGSNLQRIVDLVSCGQAITQDLAEWVNHKLDKRRIDKLKLWGMVTDVSLSPGQPLSKHLIVWHDGLVNRGRGEDYAELRYQRAKKLFEEAGAVYHGDIDAERVQGVLAEWDGKFSDYTRAHYLSAARSFCRWMKRTGRASGDPLAILPVSRGKQKYHRCALTITHQQDIVVLTRGLGLKFDVTGFERSILYWVALATGLRASAIRRLNVGDIYFDRSYIHSRSGGASNKSTSPKPLPKSLIDALRSFVVGLNPEDKLFNLPDETKLARMLRADAKECGVPTEGLDFHALRHTFGTTMARNGTHPRTLMSLMDHKTIQMTMKLYTHSFPEDEVAAVGRLPDLGGGQQKKKEVV